MKKEKRIYLSPPYQNGEEEATVIEVLRSNWLSTVGPHIAAFEEAITEITTRRAIAVNSGTAALHLILHHLNIGPGDEVLVSNFTFVASVNPVVYCGATPVLIDCEQTTWNACPDLLETCLKKKAAKNRLPKALVLVHLYGMPARLDDIRKLCVSFGVILIEDVAEAFGSKYHDKPLGSFGEYGLLSFNGNKIITTTGGGAVLGPDVDMGRILKLSTQSKEDFAFYQHEEIGFNYRISNLSAGLGLAQLHDLESRVEAKRKIFQHYKEQLSDLVSFLDEPEGVYTNRWLTTALLPNGIDPVEVCRQMEIAAIECRPLWKPMHLQPLYQQAECYHRGESERLFNSGICLPSGVGLSRSDQERVIETLRGVIEH